MANAASRQSRLPAWLLGLRRHRGILVPLGFVNLLVVILVPLPPWLMDVLISANISLAVIVLLTTIYMERPLDFSVFPSLLLATTLLRLVLNIASTRLILTADAPNADAAMGVAGQVIAAFGDFVAGNSLFVGIIIFLIVVIVQFIVVTKGATRISEVAARFTLDAMPGKQMAIDSDLNAGIIDEVEARRRRDEIRQEADFFGAMDGASKFVRGDAIAGIIITAINIIGGFAVGTIEHGWTAAESAAVFTRLTIGDGLTSQIPSFVISIAAALIVTRSGSKDQLGDELTDQLVSQPRGLIITAIFLGVLALTPLPTLPLLSTAIGLGLLAFAMLRTARTRRKADPQRTQSDQATPLEPPPVDSLLKVDTLELEVGYALVALVDTQQGGDLLDRISAVRRQLAVEMGFVMPPVRVRDNMQIDANEYRVKIRGSVIANGQSHPGRLLAMDSGLASGDIEGTPTKEPAFGLDAWWIDPALRARAETMNYTVVDPTSVIATHLSELTKRHAAELLSREEVANMVENLKQRAPKLVEEAIPAIVKMADLQKVLQNLLRERVPVRDLETIVETMADWAPKTGDLDVLTEYVRNALRRAICQQHAAPTDDGRARIVCVTIDPAFEDKINAYVDRSSGSTSVAMPAKVANTYVAQIMRALEQLTSAGHLPIILCSPQVRAPIHQLVSPRVSGLVVLAYNEIVNEVEVESVALVAEPQAEAVGAA